MVRPILLITRSWQGIGGMQRLSRDLAAELAVFYGDRFQVIHPQTAGIWGMVSFLIRAVIAALRMRGMRPFIHMGDMSLLPFGCILRLLSGGKLSVMACGLDVIYPAQWYQFVLRWSLPYAQRIVCISHATREQVIARGVSPAKTIVIPCGIDATSFSASHDVDSILIITVGRLIPRKGVAWFIEHVFPRILSVEPNVRYVVVGAGPEESHIRMLIERHHLGYAVELVTNSDDAMRDEYLGRAAVFVMPNIPIQGDMEGFGIACIEAAASGTPVAGARIEGLTDAVIDGKTGILFASHDADACAAAVLELLRSPPSRVVVSQEAHAHFSWENLLPLYTQHVFID